MLEKPPPPHPAPRLNLSRFNEAFNRHLYGLPATLALTRSMFLVIRLLERLTPEEMDPVDVLEEIIREWESTNEEEI